MDWQNIAEDAVTRYIPDAAVRDLVLAEIRGAQRSADLRPRPDQLAFRAVREDKLPGLFAERGPAYRSWYLKDGAAARPSLGEARSALERHMPELVPMWSALVAAVGADELGARMLTMYDPPPLLSGCSQAALPGQAALVRNYDYDPNLFDAVVLETCLADTRVIGMADQLWGLLDGVNDRGLAVSLTFGGRRGAGRGFSIPIVVRYLLETCATVAEGVAALERIPVQAAYNVTLVDRHANHATVWLAAGEPARVTFDRVATNHQGVVDWPEYAHWTRTVERFDELEGLLEHDAADVIDGMLQAPMRSTDYEGGFGTLYTAVYRPADGTAEYHWPGAAWRQSLDGLPRGGVRRGDRRGRDGMSRREVLEAVAAGRLDPAEAARLLDAPAAGARSVRVRSAYQAVEIVGDPEVAELLVVDGTHRVQREGDVLIVGDAASEGFRFGTWQGARRLAVRVNPRLDVDAEVTGALLSVRGVDGAMRAVVQAGSAGIEGASGSLDLRVTSGSAAVAGSPRGDWRLRSESASLNVVLDARSDATVSVTGRHSRVDAFGSETHAVLGSGVHAIDIDAAFSDVVVRTP